MNPVSQRETPIQTVRGMHDILPGKSADVIRIETKAREVFSRFGYQEIRTPVLESTDLFERAIGQTTDIVEKEMFTLKDRGERSLCLRPEGTAGVVRSLIENGLLNQSAAVKLFYVGPMFRAERPQKGRYREFIQIGSEYFGNASPAADAETIHLVLEILRSAGIESVETRLNSIGCGECRPKYLEQLLQFLKGKSPELCRDCQNRMERNPLRALDCKEDSAKLSDAPKPQDHLCENCRSHFETLKKLLRAAGIQFEIVSNLVRGLDYYTRTVFEIYPLEKTGSQDALAAGGRYDKLVEELGGEPTPAVGFALGVERVLNQIAEEKEEASAVSKGIFVAAMGEPAMEKSFQLMSQLRSRGFTAEGTLNQQSLKSQMRLADKLAMRFCLIIGENELKENFATLRDLKNQSQEKVPFDQIETALKQRLEI